MAYTDGAFWFWVTDRKQFGPYYDEQSAIDDNR